MSVKICITLCLLCYFPVARVYGFSDGQLEAFFELIDVNNLGRISINQLLQLRINPLYERGPSINVDQFKKLVRRQNAATQESLYAMLARIAENNERSNNTGATTNRPSPAQMTGSRNLLLGMHRPIIQQDNGDTASTGCSSYVDTTLNLGPPEENVNTDLSLAPSSSTHNAHDPVLPAPTPSDLAGKKIGAEDLTLTLASSVYVQDLDDDDDTEPTEPISATTSHGQFVFKPTDLSLAPQEPAVSTWSSPSQSSSESPSSTSQSPPPSSSSEKVAKRFKRNY
ncbi:uncharacterized protein LOC126846214 [Adelges cooleyi]|uniref:uncharacterized protein LOC126846214 n=1 Tax=Adelges cooleyi TaxID=133065 RepID=UPI0021807509|nr:uncharacterized protein LOC126846214 [Adelges cooleyi]